MELFRHQARKEGRHQPLANRMRPTQLSQFFGQGHLVGDGRILARILSTDRVPSMILWGPPGTGKTTLARIIAANTGARFETLSAVGSGVKELRALVAKGAEARDAYSKRTILFIDEIHRFNKAQQDALLPHVEDGTVVLIGATTENPSFEVNSALLSRARVIRLEALSTEELVAVVEQALDIDAQIKEYDGQVSREMRRKIAEAAHGDARKALTTLEVVCSLAGTEAVDDALLAQALSGKTLLYDRSGDEHYNVVSAFIKSMRGSDPDAAVYWMTRMLEAGEDPRFVIRRIVIFAAEDVGCADPQALVIATSALSAFELVGMPEGVLPLTQAVIYLATAPKSNSSLASYGKARKAVRQHGALPVPMHLRNAPTQLMQQAGYGKGYRYPHDFDGNYVPARYLPEAIRDVQIFEPADTGYEREIGERLREWNKRRDRAEESGEEPERLRDSHP